MRSILSPLSVLFLIALCLGHFVQGQSTAQESKNNKLQEPGMSEPQEIVSRQTYQNSTTLAKLGNGLTVIVQENHIAPVATVRCYVKNTGSVNEGKYLGSGLSHVLEHVVAGGSTTKRSEKEIQRLIDTFGGVTNAYTSLNQTVYFIDCPAKNVHTCIELLADSMQHAAFVEDEFNRELEVVQRELADGQVNRSRVSWKLMQETMFRVSPARIPIIGYLDVLRQMKKEQIVDFYRTRYTPNNQVFVVVGDVDTEKVLTQVAQEWSQTPRGFLNDSVLPEEPEQISSREAYTEMDGVALDVTLAWPTVRLEDPDMAALDVLSYMFSTGDSSRLVRDMQYERQLVLGVSSGSFTPNFVRGYFAIQLSVEPGKETAAIHAVEEHILRVQQEKVSESELAKVKKQKAAELVFGRQTIQDAAESLGGNYLSTGDLFYDDTYVRQIHDVTAEDVQRVAKKYFVAQRLNKITVAPKGYAAKQHAAATSESPSSADTTLVKLDNGIRVLVKRLPQLPLVNMKVYALGGNIMDSYETSGRSTLMASLLDKGSKNYTSRQIAEYFDSVGGSIGFSSGRNSVSGGITVLSEDFPKASALLAECFLHPTFPEEGFLQAKTLMLGMIKRRSSNPQAELIETFADALPATTPYHITLGGKEETISALSVRDMQSTHKALIDPSRMVVAVYGDVDPEATIHQMKELFGSVSVTSSEKTFTREACQAFFNRSNKLAENAAIHKTTEKPTGMVLIAYEAPSVYQEDDYASMQLLNSIMAGYGYPGGWLHDELRGNGLVYSVYGTMLTGTSPGYFILGAQTSPDKISDVVNRLRKNVQRALDGDISEDEFLVAREQVLAYHAQSGTTAGEQATTAGVDELFGFGYSYDKTYDARLGKVTLEDVKRAAKKYLGSKSLQITTSPDKTLTEAVVK